MIGTKPKSTRPASMYRVPTLDELIQICVDFELISTTKVSGDRMKIKCKEDYFDVTLREAEVLVRGLLLGYFAHQTRDDLGLSDWEE